MGESNTKLVRERKVWHRGEILTITDDIFKRMQAEMFLEIWSEREHMCELSHTLLFGDPAFYYFHHILEKRNFELYGLCKWNIIILTWAIHDAYERNPDTYPELFDMRNNLLAEIDTGKYEFDNDAIWKKRRSTKSLPLILGVNKLINQTL